MESQIKITSTEESEVASLKAQLRGIELLLQQNAALEMEVSRLCGELTEATMGIQKKGYLHKWRDREISFASKWGLRYFVLRGNTISYFGDDRETRPRRTISLSRCTVRNDGVKKSGQFFVFSIYLDAGQGSSLVLRLSSENSAEASLWIDMLEQACTLGHDELALESSKPVISDDVDQVMKSPLSIDCNTNIEDEEPEPDTTGLRPIIDELSHEDLLPLMSPVMLKRVKSSTRILEKAAKVLPRRDSRELISGGSASPGKERTFVSSSTGDNVAKSLTPAAAAADPHLHRPPRLFPASKPMHVQCQHAPLSSDVRPGEQNYRGFFNLGVIILFLTHFRLVLDNLVKYGILFSLTSAAPAVTEISEPVVSPWASPKIGQSLLSWIAACMVVYAVEVLAAKKMLSNSTVLALHYVLGTANIVLPCLWVWTSHSNPLLCLVYLLQSVIMWMKLISYAHTNRDLRMNLEAQKQADTTADVNDDHNAKPLVAYNVFSEVKDLEAPYLQYPLNLTVVNLAYFALVPTLCYQLNYPRTPTIRWRYVLTFVLRLVAVSALVMFTVEQYVKPTLSNSMQAMEDMDLLEIFKRLLKLSIPNTYVWLLGFYWFFHLWLNLLAELTRFGDRQFYKDWWNARTIDTYWRTWNMPVHHWMLRHLYYPLVRLGVSKGIATLVVFAFSAIFHEVIISVPFRHISFHAFAGMLAQAPLIFVTKAIDKRFGNAFIGNAIFWCVFCVVGQPMGVILYYFDLWKNSQK